MPRQRPVISPVFSALLSGVLLFLSYPPFSLGFLAWFAFIPFFMALSQASSLGGAFLTGFGTGFVFFFVSIQWFIYVTPLGWVLAAGFEALFIGLFAACVYETRTDRHFLLRLFLIGAAWTAAEFLRAKFPILGFGWNLLGDSQAFSETIVQTANVFGVYGLGFVVMAVNGCLYEIIDRRLGARDQKPKKKRSRVTGPLSVVIIIFVLLISHGIYHKKHGGKHSGDFKISVIQGNIPQSVKWEVMARDKIIEIYSKLTQLASFDGPSLIIWPEAAYPGYFNRDTDAAIVKNLVKQLEVPVLVGAPHLENDDVAYNSAYLVGSDGEIKKRYDKQILVPFGEYVPLKTFLGGLTKFAYSLGVSDFTAGREKIVFDILNHEISFSVLICFEDTFPELAREFVDRGAQFLTVITNDAWFGNSGAAAQHLQASILRAVENGVPVVRAANTGISGFISNRGKVLGRVTEKGRDIFVAGRETAALPIDKKETLYRAGGWIFPYVVSGLFVIILANVKTRDRKRQASDKKGKS